MADIAKVLIMIGIFIMILGLSLYAVSKIPGLGKLPGDILIKKENFSFYFPLTTCLLMSILLSLILWLWQRR